MKASTIDRLIITVFIIAIVLTNTLQSYAIISSIERSSRTEICALRAILIQQTPELANTNGILKACDQK